MRHLPRSTFFNAATKRFCYAKSNHISLCGCFKKSSTAATLLQTPQAGAARLDGLHPSLKNVRQTIPPNGQSRLKFGFRYENFTTQSFSVLPTPFRLNVS